jgi:hypothetical protein
LYLDEALIYQSLKKCEQVALAALLPSDHVCRSSILSVIAYASPVDDLDVADPGA